MKTVALLGYGIRLRRGAHTANRALAVESVHATLSVSLKAEQYHGSGLSQPPNRFWIQKTVW